MDGRNISSESWQPVRDANLKGRCRVGRVNHGLLLTTVGVKDTVRGQGHIKAKDLTLNAKAKVNDLITKAKVKDMSLKAMAKTKDLITKAKAKDLSSEPRRRARHTVLEVLRGQEHGLEDSNTAAQGCMGP